MLRIFLIIQLQLAAKHLSKMRMRTAVILLVILVISGFSCAEAAKVTKPKIAAPKVSTQLKAKTTTPAAPALLSTVATSEAPAPVQPPPVFKSGLSGLAGFGGGAGTLGISYIPSFTTRYAPGFRVSTGYGLAMTYTHIFLQGGALYKIRPNLFALLSFDWVNYSSNVRKLVGLPEMSKGNNYGLGLSLGGYYNNVEVMLGYSTVLGITLTASYPLY